MFDNVTKKINKLSEIECVIYEISGAIYTRENDEILKKELQKFEDIINKQFTKINFDLESIKNDKQLLLNRYQNILKGFLDTVESLYAYIQEKIQTAETNQNVIMIKKNTLEYVDELLSNAKTNEEKEEIIKITKVLNVSTNNLSEKIYMTLEKINKYEEIINLCSKEFEVCNYTRQVEVKEFLNKDFNIELSNDSNLINKKVNQEKNKNKIISSFSNFLEELENNVSVLNNNIENYNYNFIVNIENIQNEILQT